jgi:hypothetical protein
MDGGRAGSDMLGGLGNVECGGNDKVSTGEVVRDGVGS